MIFSEFPEFEQSAHWKEHLEFWDGEKQTVGLEMSTFSSFIADALKNDTHGINFEKVFRFIEFLMIEGDQVVQNAAATQFLVRMILRNGPTMILKSGSV